MQGGVNAFLRLNYELFVLSGSVDIVDVELFAFEHTCQDPPPLNLGHVSTGSGGFDAGTLVLHAGELAELREPLYREIADHVINTARSSPKLIAQRLLSQLR